MAGGHRGRDVKGAFVICNSVRHTQARAGSVNRRRIGGNRKPIVIISTSMRRRSSRRTSSICKCGANVDCNVCDNYVSSPCRPDGKIRHKI